LRADIGAGGKTIHDERDKRAAIVPLESGVESRESGFGISEVEGRARKLPNPVHGRQRPLPAHLQRHA
jgi:hypothetical protein